jgi:hypothetical protein
VEDGILQGRQRVRILVVEPAAALVFDDPPAHRHAPDLSHRQAADETVAVPEQFA